MKCEGVCHHALMQTNCACAQCTTIDPLSMCTVSCCRHYDTRNDVWRTSTFPFLAAVSDGVVRL